MKERKFSYLYPVCVLERSIYFFAQVHEIIANIGRVHSYQEIEIL